MRKLLVALLIVTLCTVPASANIIDDIYGAVFGETNPQITEWNNASYEYGSVTLTIDSDGICTINYNVTKIPEHGGIVVELGVFDSVGYLMPIWGGSVTTPDGTFTVNLVTDLQQTSIDPSKYYVRVVDTSERWV